MPLLALTATADAPTRHDIIAQLGLDRAPVFAAGYDRPNLFYRIVAKRSPLEQLWQFLAADHPADAGIVYCFTRKAAEETASWLAARGRTALTYHAGLDGATRERNQERFLREEGVVVAATIAFGMGIDKPNVRFVAHLDAPKNLEAYYQETGRAGRDGLPADAWMSYGIADVMNLLRLIDAGDTSERQRRIERQKIEALIGYCETVSCRRQVLLGYFGERDHPPCGNCDNCREPVASWDGTIAAQKALSAVYRTGQRFGAHYLVDVLLGADSERIKRLGHDRLKTFAVGTELDRRGWLSVFRQLVAQGFVIPDIGRAWRSLAGSGGSRNPARQQNRAFPCRCAAAGAEDPLTGPKIGVGGRWSRPYCAEFVGGIARLATGRGAPPGVTALRDLSRYDADRDRAPPAGLACRARRNPRDRPQQARTLRQRRHRRRRGDDRTKIVACLTYHQGFYRSLREI